jgi:hypothetical protein
MEESIHEAAKERKRPDRSGGSCENAYPRIAVYPHRSSTVESFSEADRHNMRTTVFMTRNTFICIGWIYCVSRGDMITQLGMQGNGRDPSNVDW